MVVLALVSIASIVTPLGLYDAIAPSTSPASEIFSYLPDDSAFGYGTPPRSTAPFTRDCSASAQTCPGQPFNQTCNAKGNICTNVTYSTIIPPTLRELFGNGSLERGSTVSGLFDIQWRTYLNTTNGFAQLGWSLIPSYRELSNLILDEKIEPVEGLIVDMVDGGIGFRNHTAPQTALDYGATWTEDILFIEPETQCVDLNITLDFEIITDISTTQGYQNIFITDRGGMSGLNLTEPSFPSSTVGQGDLQLRERAYVAAWLNNYMTMSFYNVTGTDPSNIGPLNITKGARFPMPLRNCSNPNDVDCTQQGLFSFDWNSIQTSTTYAGYLNLGNSTNMTNSLNPNGVSTEDLDGISKYFLAYPLLSSPVLDEQNTNTSLLLCPANTCVGTVYSSPVNINSTLVGCYLLYGAPNRTDGGSSLLAFPGSPWSTPIYSCATAIKASIRTVTFSYNGTGLEALNITSAYPKAYPNDSSLPLWGVETLSPDFTFDIAQPLWGLLGSSNSSVHSALPSSLDNISTVAQPSLYLPGYMDQVYFIQGGDEDSLVGSSQNLPGVDFYPKCLQTAIGISNNPFTTDTGVTPGTDYSGYTSLALFAKWQSLSRSADKAGTIVNLIWTDDAANSVVGTRGQGLRTVSVGTGNAQTESIFETPTRVPIIIYSRTIRYHIPFAVPAFVVLATSILLLGLMLVLLVLRKTGAARMRRMLEATSVGRVVGTGVWPETLGTAGKTNSWIKKVGERPVRITEGGIVAEKTGWEEAHDGDVSMEPEAFEDGNDDAAASKARPGELVRLVPLGLRPRT